MRPAWDTLFEDTLKSQPAGDESPRVDRNIVMGRAFDLSLSLSLDAGNHLRISKDPFLSNYLFHRGTSTPRR